MRAALRIATQKRLRVGQIGKVEILDSVASTEQTRSDPDVSIVVPTYGSAHTLHDLFQRLEAAASASPRRWEIVIVDDGSPDDTWATLQALKAEAHAELPIRLVRLLKNAGQHNALIAGLRYARGQCIVTMDDDLQHPPESVDALIDAVEDGQDLVIASFERKQHGAGRNLGGFLVDTVIRRLFGLAPEFQLTSFRAMRSRVAEIASQTQEPDPYLTALLLQNARRVSNLQTPHHPNTARRTHYNLLKSARLAANLVFGYSSLPFALILTFGVIAVITAGLALGWAASSYFAGSNTVPGWASTIAMIAFFNALNLAAIAALAVYIGRMHRQMTGKRQIFVVEDVHD